MDVEIPPLLTGLLSEMSEHPRCTLRVLWEPVPSDCTGCCTQISGSELPLVWRLDTEPDECAFAESASPATPVLQKAVTALSAPPAQPKSPESLPTASALIQAQPLAFGSYADTRCSEDDDDVQTIPQCLQLFAPAQTCFCSG